MSSTTLTSCLAALLTMGLASSCRSHHAPSGDRDDHRAGAAISTQPVASAGTQIDLARELDATEHTADPDASLAAVRERWQGKHLTWTVTRQSVLCRDAEACHVVPFPAPRPAEVESQGWLPALEFAPGQFAKLVAACGAAAMCQVTFAGDLASLEVSSELPTSLRFTNVTVVTAIAAAATATAPAGPVAAR